MSLYSSFFLPSPIKSSNNFTTLNHCMGVMLEYHNTQVFVGGVVVQRMQSINDVLHNFYKLKALEVSVYDIYSSSFFLFAR